MFDQTQQNPYGAPVNAGGYSFNGYGAQAAPKVMNVLTEEEIRDLQQSHSQFSLGLTERESRQAACNHRSIDGTSDSLVFDSDTGKARCTICGYEFRPIEPDVSYEDIKDASDRLVDILQTIKIMYTDLPANAAREYFQIIPLIGKIPQLFEFAAKNFAKHEFNAWGYQNANMGGMAMLNGLNALFGASQGYNPYAAPQPQGYYGAPAPQPGYPVYPQPGAPVVTGAPAPTGNPFGFAGASQQAYQPNPAAQGYQYNPQAVAPQPTAPVAPGAPAPQPADAATADTTVTQKVTV